jgi:uncharacterized protein with HEPN domain
LQTLWYAAALSAASRSSPRPRVTFRRSARAAHPQIPWRNIADIGNVLRHGYRLVDHAVIWSVVQDHLPALRTALEQMRRDIEASESE